MAKKGIWVLYESVNDYNQYGDYMRGFWFIKPTASQIHNVANCISIHDINQRLLHATIHDDDIYFNDGYYLSYQEESD